MTKTYLRLAKAPLACAALSLYCERSFAADWTAATGPTVSSMSSNVSASLFGSVSGFEAFLYLLGIIFFCDVLRRTVNHAKNSNNAGRGEQGSWISSIVVQLVLSVFCFTAPSVVGSARSTIFGSAPVTSVKSPGPTFN